VCDSGNSTIRRVTFDGVMTTLAGTPGADGFVDGFGTRARFFRPSGIVADHHGRLFVADTHNHRIRIVSPTGMVSTLAGGRFEGYSDGLGTLALFRNPYALALEDARPGSILIGDRMNNLIRRLQLSGGADAMDIMLDMPDLARFPSELFVLITAYIPQEGIMSTVATCPPGVYGMAFHEEISCLYVTSDHLIRRVPLPPNGPMAVANSGSATVLAGKMELMGHTGAAMMDGVGDRAQFYYPGGIVLDLDPRFSGLDRNLVSPTKEEGNTGGRGLERVKSSSSSSSRVHPQDCLFVADTFNQNIRRLAPIPSSLKS